MESEAGIMHLTTLYKATTSCKGDLIIDACILTPAIIEYHVILVNNTIALDPAYTYRDDKFINVTLALVNTIKGPTTYGGLWLVLNTMLESSAHLNSAGPVGYDIISSGLPAFEYVNSTDTLETPDYSIN